MRYEAKHQFFKGLLSWKMHFLMYFIHKYVSPGCQGTHKVSENKTLSLFLLTYISKNGGTMELIQMCYQYDVISEMWAGFTATSLSETMRNVFGSNMVFVYISKHRYHSELTCTGESMCKKAGNTKRNWPCSKPAREKAFELHTVSEIILEVVWNTIWRLITAAFSWVSADREETSLHACRAQKGMGPAATDPQSALL